MNTSYNSKEWNSSLLNDHITKYTSQSFDFNLFTLNDIMFRIL